jgi:hypothetical protein
MYCPATLRGERLDVIFLDIRESAEIPRPVLVRERRQTMRANSGSLTRRNVGGSHMPENHTAETGLPKLFWAGR